MSYNCRSKIIWRSKDRLWKHGGSLLTRGAVRIHFTLYDGFVLDNEPPDSF